MDTSQSASAFTAKWQDRWPEWRIAQVFVAPSQHAVALAWFALRQELLDAAWAGSDPRPGEAKLGWWAEELLGWTQGRRRHPLGIVLQRTSAAWSPLATAAIALAATREPARDADEAILRLTPFAEAAIAIDAALLASPQPASATAVVAGLLCEQIVLLGDAAAPLQLRARQAAAVAGHLIAEQAVARAWAGEVLQRWPPHGGSRAGRILAALERQRLARFAAGQAAFGPVPRWPTLWTAWRAARG
ncbi:phytoene/squalene synthase family protein [Cognatiluteimonas profundi]|uniref:phytoene/squalene synthase family protein n=1 Tax=Cognatiluteimonas profundi TaxID=2594501 RepID=UPI00131B5860|nr:phytoene/squalene synthase family protein [Lysobacter profundi]